MKSKMDELELKYKVESLEKRLDNIERMLYMQQSNGNSGNGGVNHEILMMLLDVMKRDSRPVAQTAQPTVQQQAPAPAQVPTAEPSAQQQPTMDSFDMFRRRSVM